MAYALSGRCGGAPEAEVLTPDALVGRDAVVLPLPTYSLNGTGCWWVDDTVTLLDSATKASPFIPG